ncbi:MAG: RNA methyltransferase [Lachnospiraceae bacterium]|nr:RNA methyltransferase [Lachnospiraceae bacterium]
MVDIRKELITDLADERLDIYARLSEPQLKRIYEPKEGLFIAESPMVIERALDAGYAAESVLTCHEALKGHGRAVIERLTGQNHSIPLYVGTDEVLGKIRGYQLTRGVLCAMRRRMEKRPEEIIGNARRIVLLDDVENPSNVGAIFRSAAAMFMDAVLLTPDCSDPLYRRAARVSVGTVFNIHWTYLSGRKTADKTDGDNADGNSADGDDADGNSADGDDAATCYIDFLHEQGFKTAAMALSDESIPVSDERLKREEKLCVIMGNEGYGLKESVIDRCDYTVKIPMAAGVDSLNVAAASAVAFWELRSGS